MFLNQDPYEDDIDNKNILENTALENTLLLYNLLKKTDLLTKENIAKIKKYGRHHVRPQELFEQALAICDEEIPLSRERSDSNITDAGFFISPDDNRTSTSSTATRPYP